MPKRAQAEIRKRIQASGNQLTIQQLCLDGIQIKNITPTIKRLLESCSNIQYLTMNDCQLKSLENFPHLKNLIGLELSDNSLTGEDLNKILHCPSINFLTLDNNRISSTVYLNHLQKLSELEILELHNNDICEEENYRESIFEMFPKLQILDCLDREGNRVREENQSDYISIIGNSRTDILELLENDDKEKTEDFVRTATEYYDEGPLGRRNSGDASQASFSSQVSNPISPIGMPYSQGSRFNQKGLVFARTGIVSDSQDQQPSDMMKDFKRKLQKKEE